MIRVMRDNRKKGHDYYQWLVRKEREVWAIIKGTRGKLPTEIKDLHGELVDELKKYRAQHLDVLNPPEFRAW